MVPPCKISIKRSSYGILENALSLLKAIHRLGEARAASSATPVSGVLVLVRTQSALHQFPQIPS